MYLDKNKYRNKNLNTFNEIKPRSLYYQQLLSLYEEGRKQTKRQRRGDPLPGASAYTHSMSANTAFNINSLKIAREKMTSPSCVPFAGYRPNGEARETFLYFRKNVGRIKIIT